MIFLSYFVFPFKSKQKQVTTLNHFLKMVFQNMKIVSPFECEMHNSQKCGIHN